MSLNESQLMHNKIVSILKTPVKEWETFKEGIIDENYKLVLTLGNLISNSRCGNHKPEFSLARVIKSNSQKGLNETSQQFYTIFMESRGLVPQTDNIAEAEVIGDSGYDANNIASGVTSGDVVSAGAQTMPKKKKKKTNKEE